MKKDNVEVQGLTDTYKEEETKKDALIEQLSDTPKAIQKRLDYFRREIESCRMSYGDIAELQGLAEYIPADDVVLLEWAGVPEYGNKNNFKKIDIFVDGKYICSTTWAKTCREAVKHFAPAYRHMLVKGKVTARFA